MPDRFLYKMNKRIKMQGATPSSRRKFNPTLMNFSRRGILDVPLDFMGEIHFRPKRGRQNAAPAPN